MSDGDLEARLRMALGDVPSKMASVATGYKKIAAEARNVQRVSADSQKELDRFFGRMKTTAAGTDHEMRKLQKSLRFTGQALGAAGIGGRGAAILEMSGGYGRLAAAALAAGLAIKVATNIYRDEQNQLELNTKAHKDYIDAVKAGEAVKDSQAKAGLGQENNIRKLVAGGGSSQIGYADRFAKRYNVDTADAQEAVANASLLPPGVDGRALEAAGQFAQSGRGTAAQAIEMIRKNPALKGRLNLSLTKTRPEDFESTSNARVDEVVDRLLSEATGERYQKGAGARIRSNLEGNSDQYLDQAKTVREIGNQGNARDRGRVSDGTAVAASRYDAGRGADPVMTALFDLNKTNQDAIAKLAEQAAVQKAYLGVLSTLGDAFKVGGVMERELRLTREAVSKAALGAR